MKTSSLVSRAAYLLAFTLCCSQAFASPDPTNDFAPVGNAVADLLKTRDTKHFAALIAPSVDDWDAVISTDAESKPNDPLVSMRDSAAFQRQQIELSAKALLDMADYLRLDFSKASLEVHVIPPDTTIATFPGSNEHLRLAESVEVVVRSGAFTNQHVAGEARLVMRGFFKFPGGWRCYNGLQWKSFPAGVADENTLREMDLLGKAWASEEFTDKDDPVLLHLGDTLVHFVRVRDIAHFQQEALMNRDLAVKQMQKGNPNPPPLPKEVEDNLKSEMDQQTKIAQQVIKILDDAGIDLKDAEIRVKGATVGRAQAAAPGSLANLMGDHCKFTLEVKSNAKSRTGTSLSGRYILAASRITRLNGEWRVADGLHWDEMPSGVLDAQCRAEMDAENYIGEHGTLPPQTAAPEIEFTTLEGQKKMKLSDLRGKAVVLDFWATWCGPCQTPMAKLQTLCQSHPDWKDKVAVVPLSIDDTMDILRRHIEKRGWTNTLNVWAGDGGWHSEPAKIFRVRGVPTTYIIAPDGKIIIAGHPESMQIDREVNDVLKTAKN
jgi:thiol-disulfide isomerase/thioredoxin